MSSRKLDSGAAAATPEGADAVRKFYEICKLRSPWLCEYEVKAILPFEFEKVWQILLESEHYSLWLDKHDGTVDAPLPKRFGIGQQIQNASDRSGRRPSYIIACEPPDHRHKAELVLSRPFYDDHPPFYYMFTVSPYERVLTRFAMRGVGPTTQTSAISQFLTGVFSKPKNNPFQNELEHCMDGALKRFTYVCHDRVHYGPVYTRRNYHRKSNWFTWDYTGGVVRYFLGRSGASSGTVGEHVKAGEQIGFIAPKDATDLEQWKERNSIEPGKGVIREILKAHGDMIQTGERLLLISESMESDLTEDVVSMDTCQIDPQSHYFNPKLVRYLANVGESIVAGGSLALGEDGEKRFKLKLRHPGVVTRHLLEAGEDLRHSAIAAIRIASV